MIPGPYISIIDDIIMGIIIDDMIMGIIIDDIIMGIIIDDMIMGHYRILSQTVIEYQKSQKQCHCHACS